MNNTATDSERWRSPDRRFAVRLTHLARGLRYWAFEIQTGHDVALGLASDGYGSMVEAMCAVLVVTEHSALQSAAA